MGAYIVSGWPNEYRTDLVDSLERFGLPSNKINIVPAFVGNECKGVGDTNYARKQEIGLFTTVANWLVQYIGGSPCYGRCWFRCYPDGRFCPPEKAPEDHHVRRTREHHILPHTHPHTHTPTHLSLIHI